MTKNILYIIFLALLLSACEKDDICLLPTTPKLILRFYDAENPNSFKNVEHLSIWAEGKDTISTYKDVTADSIALSLDTNSTQTIYNLKTSTSGNIVDNRYNKITIDYTKEEIFVSRSCGLKVHFNAVTIDSDNGWIQSITPNTIPTIDHETSAHFEIYH